MAKDCLDQPYLHVEYILKIQQGEVNKLEFSKNFETYTYKYLHVEHSDNAGTPLRGGRGGGGGEVGGGGGGGRLGVGAGRGGGGARASHVGVEGLRYVAQALSEKNK